MSGAVGHRTQLTTSDIPRTLQTKCPCDRHTWNGQNWVTLVDMNQLSCKDVTKKTDICSQNTSNMGTDDMPDDLAGDVDGLKEVIGFHSTWGGNTCVLAPPFNVVKHGHVISGSGLSSATCASTKSRKRPAIDPFVKLIEESILDDACKRRTDLKSSVKAEVVPARVCCCGCHVPNGQTPSAVDESRNGGRSGELPRRSMLKLLLTEVPPPKVEDRPKVGSFHVKTPDPADSACGCQIAASVRTVVQGACADEVSRVHKVQQLSMTFSENSSHKATAADCCRDVPGCKALPNLLQNYIDQLRKKHVLMKQSLLLQESSIALLESEVKHIGDTGHSSVQFQRMYDRLTCIKINKGSQQAELRRLQDKVNQQKKLHSTLSEGVSSTQKAEVESASPPCEARTNMTNVCVCARNRPKHSTSAATEAPRMSNAERYATAENLVSIAQTYSAANNLVSSSQTLVPSSQTLVSTDQTYSTTEALVSTPQIYTIADDLVSTGKTFCSKTFMSTPQTYPTTDRPVSTPQTYPTTDRPMSTPQAHCSAETIVAISQIDLGEIEPTLHPTMSDEQMDMGHEYFLSNDLIQFPSSTLSSNTCSPTSSGLNTPDCSFLPSRLTASFSCPSLSNIASGPKSSGDVSCSNNSPLVCANGELTPSPPKRALPTPSGHTPSVVDLSGVLSSVRNSADECSSTASPAFTFSSQMLQTVPSAISKSCRRSEDLLLDGKDGFLSRLERFRRIRAAYAKLPPARFKPISRRT